MGSLLAYSGLTTKLRAMESQLISEEEYRQISEMVTVGEVLAFLKRRPSYAEILATLDEYNARRGEIESLLNYSLYDYFMRIYRFASQEQRRFMELYFKKYEVSLLKRCLRLALDHRAHNFELAEFESFFRKHSQLDIDKLAAADSMDALVGALKGTEYYPILRKLTEKSDVTLFDYEMVLDMHYFFQMWQLRGKLCRGKDLDSLSSAWGAKCDMINLNWIYRSIRYYQLSPAEIYALLSPVRYKLSRQDLISLAEAGSEEEFQRILEGTWYAKRFKELSVENLEEMYIQILSETLRKESRDNPYSVIMIYSYLYRKKHEVDRLTTALECIRYGLASDVILQTIRKQ